MTAELRRDSRSQSKTADYVNRARFSGIAVPPVMLLLLLLMAACDLNPAPATPTPAPTPDPLADALSRIPNARSVKIRDDWTGLSPAAPILAHYLLDRTAEGLAGTAEFAAGEYRGTPITATETITIPEDVMQDFLARLAAVPLEEGTYTPKIEHTDDYPNISITVEIPADIISFYTQSQGEDHTPWGATIANKEYVVETPEIAEALRLLEPYLKRDALEQVIEDASNR